MNHFIHSTPGRLRIKIPTLKGNPIGCQAVRSHLDSTSGINSVITNAVTGSVILHYDVSRITEGDLLNLLQKNDVVDVSKITTSDPFVHETLSKAGKVIQKAAVSLVLDRMLGGTPFSLLTVLL